MIRVFARKYPRYSGLLYTEKNISHININKIDVRICTSKAVQFIKQELFDLGKYLRGKNINVNSVEFLIDNDRISENARKFFERAEEATVAVVCSKEYADRFEGKDEKIKFLSIHSEKKLEELDVNDVNIFLIDPYYKMRKIDSKILGMEDYDSEGLRILRRTLRMKSKRPVYLLETEKHISETDRKTLYMKGVRGTVDANENMLDTTLSDLLYSAHIQEKCTKMLDRGKVIDFETLHEARKKGNIAVKFYDIMVKDAVRSEDTDLLVDIDERPDVKFSDVIGAENAKRELGDFLRYLNDPGVFLRNTLGAPKGILLYGPPGTGKTMLARAMAGEAEASFISISAGELRSSYPGEGEERVKRLFSTARRYTPAIIFIDEVDSIAKKRTGGINSYAGDESILNVLLTEMDGFFQDPDAPVFIIAATNFGIEESDNPMKGELDPAFLRRFSNKILIDLPSRNERIIYINRVLRGEGKHSIENDVTDTGINSFALMTKGETVATLENILNLAFRNALRKGIKLTDSELDNATQEYFYGVKKEKNEEQLMKTAVHEASHAYVYFKSGKIPSYLTVISRANFGGYMQKEDDEVKTAYTREEYLWEIRTALAGRVGERVVYGSEASLNTGAVSDLKSASKIAIMMLSTYGMYEDHLLTLDTDTLIQSDLFPEYANKVEEILKEQEEKCFKIITEGKDVVQKLAEDLADKGHLDQEEIKTILEGPASDAVDQQR